MINVRLEPHTSGRSQAVAAKRLAAGSLIVSCDALTTVLLPQEKGQRCDACHTKSPGLQKCSGCAAYFYCSTKCQNIQWQAHHKRICKRFNKYTSSLGFQALAPHEKLDALLLSHLVAQLDGADSAVNDPLNSILSLLPGPSNLPTPQIAYSSPRITVSEVKDWYAKFGNNNFVIHSHLTTFGHGIFPLASRLFNHSCLPNAAAKYILSPSSLPKMEVVALRDISPEEEICLTYLDPALLQTRQQIFQLTYGFECRCTSCLFFEKVGPIPGPPTDPGQRDGLSVQLLQFMKDTPHDGMSLGSATFPSNLLPIFHESYITDVAEIFRNASHDGPYAVALSSGKTLLALYRLIYPPNYPQIGMHLLELAKTSWNRIVSENMDASAERVMKAECRMYLNEAKGILQILGPEGNEDGPLVEIKVLESVLEEP